MYHWISNKDGYYIFEDRIYRVGKLLRFPDLDDRLKDCNYFCFTRYVEDARLICDLLNRKQHQQ